MQKLKNEELNRLSEDEFRNADKNPVILILDDVRSLNNVGSAFRTSDAFLIEKIYLCGITGTPPHREIQKTALGATETVAWEYVENICDLVKKLQSENCIVYPVEQAENSTMLNDLQLESDKKYAFVFGNEVMGVNQEVIDLCGKCLEIPQFGSKHSFNISVSIGIVLWDVMGKLGKVG